MGMRVKNPPQILQIVMNYIFEKNRGKSVVVYMDDIVVYSKNIEVHNRLLKKVFNALRTNKTRVNPRKLQIGQKTVELLRVSVKGWD
ncbi:hypothetical protein PAEPH01_2322 [Pancytospora epiphaga]|nr:hypothetical protein PAEPH01_2322 [Pancytospora epiphaga]